MITERVKRLFDFINFLHGKTEYFSKKRHLIEDALELKNKRNTLKPDENYKDRIEYNKLQAVLEKKFDVAEKETTKLIKAKIIELGIADVSTPITYLNAWLDLLELQRNFDENDLKVISDTKRKYLEFRTKTDCHYFLEIFFNNLDRELKEFFDYFKDTKENEFEPFEIKILNVNSIEEAVEQIHKGGNTSAQKKIYKDFEELFADAANNGALGAIKDQLSYSARQNTYNYNFNIWLMETKGLRYGNNSQYQTFLSKEIFSEFLRWENQITQKHIQERAKEKASWIISAQKENESPETLFEKIKDWDTSSQIGFSVQFDEPARTELFNKILDELKDEAVKQNVLLIKQRIDKATFVIPGYTTNEIHYYQSVFAKDFYFFLHLENFTTYIEDKIRECFFYCKGLNLDLQTKPYEFLEDREHDKKQLTEAERYKTYLENLLSQFTNPPTQETEKSSETKPTITAYAIMHVYLSLYKGQSVTQQNKDSLAKKYGYRSGDQLRNDFTKYQNEEARLGIHTTNKRSANAHLKRFEDILPLLKGENKQAYDRAFNDYEQLKYKYNKHY